MDVLAPQATQADAANGCSKRVFWSIFAVTLLLSAVLLFVRLGHYALWDDEARDALCAKSVLLTGDTKAFVGHNFIGYNNGDLLANLRCEGIPPLVAYIGALSMKVLGVNAWAVRLPLALFGLGCVAVMFRWMWKWRASAVTVSVFSIALLANVSFFLYCRQCHYYGVSMFFSTLIAYLYVNWRGGVWRGAAMALCLALLMPANPCFFIAVCLCLLVDYLVWQRKIRPVSFGELAAVFLPSFFMGLVMLRWWNPLHCNIASWLNHNTLSDRLTLFAWYLRDINHSEMLVGLLLPFAFIAAFTSRNAFLKRGLAAMFVYIAAMTFLSDQILKFTSCADVRFLSSLIPLFIAIGVFTLRWLVEASAEIAWPAIPLAVVVFGTNLCYGGGLILPEGMRSTLYCFAGELWNPPSDPYTETSRWVREHVRPGETIWVQPHAAVGPLMFHAPAPLYAWQLNMEPKGQFASLEPIHFQGKIPPDYMVAFGPDLLTVQAEIKKQNENGVDYQLEASVNCYWKDLYRPELFWRSFEAIRQFNPSIEAIYIYKRTPGPLQN